jgi:5-deoxy-D-glucuronate isomerase
LERIFTHAYACIYAQDKECRKRGQCSRHTLDAPGSKYVPAGQSVHVAVAAAVDLAGPYAPAAQGEPVHVEAPSVADSEVTRVSRGTYNTHQTV